ncbi:MAG: tRNA (adenosine(37)-N6)-threonylcarbamoyltransferase complex dimerization subunit type 1 TsaB [Lentisphaerae bacterium]|jgi:tRNA threonylcarbamoyl adenosine modification protein YeaZ|nr:tRNA (adenosine(37)-N6)-threonylcarbamoyltransferase complex dimerization subunit type 1 TsaB [Lentisphaerota bacterium]
MRIFSIELSSRFGSIALVEDRRVVVEQRWEENFKNRQQLFDAVEAMAIDWDSVGAFAVGRGPGAFSGMRIAFSVVNTLAQVGAKPVYALNSGAVLAKRFGAEQTVVVGDARRKQVWAGLFRGAQLEREFELLELDQLTDYVPSGALVVSPDYDRLEELLAGFHKPDPPESVFPTAGELGILIAKRVAAGEASEPLEPLYMHPPVFIEPRFST